MEDDLAASTRPTANNKFGFKIYENLRTFVKKSSGNSKYDLLASPSSSGNSDGGIPTYEDVEITANSNVISLESESNESVVTVIKNNNDGNATDDSGIDSIDHNNSAAAGLSFKDVKSAFSDTYGTLKAKKQTWRRELVFNDALGETPDPGGPELTSIKRTLTSPEPPKTVTSGSGPNSRVPIYSSVLKPPRKSNPARDFALTVLEDAATKSSTRPCQATDLSELSALLSETNQLLNRNSNLRASLTISVKRSNSKKATSTTTIVLPKGGTPAAAPGSDPDVIQNKFAAKVVDIPVDDVEPEEQKQEEEDVSDVSTLPSLEPEVSPFTRYNPARKPINPGGGGGNSNGNNNMEIRRSVKLKPKTVANLASKFDGLLTTTTTPKSNNGVGPGGGGSLGERERKMLCSKKDITQIIGTLEKLDEEAKKSSLVLVANKIKNGNNVSNGKSVSNVGADGNKVVCGEPQIIDEKKTETVIPAATNSVVKIVNEDSAPKGALVSTIFVDNSNSSNNDISDKMRSAKSLMDKIDLPSSDTTEAAEANLSVNTDHRGTDKYLDNLKKLARTNADSGVFRTSIPKPPRAFPPQPQPQHSQQLHKQTLIKNTLAQQKSQDQVAQAGHGHDLGDKRSFHGSVLSALNHSYMDLAYDEVGNNSNDNNLAASKKFMSEDNISLLTYDPVQVQDDLLVKATPAIGKY